MKICKLGCPLRNVGTHSGQWSGKWREGLLGRALHPKREPFTCGSGPGPWQHRVSVSYQWSKKKDYVSCAPPPPCDGEDEMGEKYELEFGSCTALDMNMKYQSLQDAARLSTS